jgi:hypothetical protein
MVALVVTAISLIICLEHESEFGNRGQASHGSSLDGTEAIQEAGAIVVALHMS